MPSLRVSLNGQCLAEVDLAGLDILTVHVSGARVDDALADVSMMGGTFSKEAPPTHLIWIDDAEALKDGDCLEVAFNASGRTSHAGKTIDELYPNEAEAFGEVNALDLLPQAIKELRAKPYVRAGYRFAMETPHGKRYDGTTGEADHGFGLFVLWDSYRPDRASVSLGTHTLDDLEHRRPTQDRVRERLAIGDAISLQVWTLRG